LAAWGLSSEAFAQGGGPNARDIFGIWGRADRLFTLSVDPPPRTAWGEEKFNSYKPSYGPRAIPPALGNDPQGNCDPLGIPRTLFLENNPGAFEFIQVPGRVLQIFERHHVWREIWTDGRELPKDAEPRWMGYSVGRWEGDTFVVNSVGFDERTWLDHFGNPHSDEMRLEERYRRADANTMEFTLKIDDPKTYTRPWMSDKKIVRLQPARAFEELFCVPSEEQAFNKRIRDPAGGIIRP
jgi:hypothetical protein